MRKPKKPKLPKQPKAKSSAEVWARYFQKIDDKMKDYNRALKVWEATNKQKKAIQEKVRKFKLANN